MKCKFHPEALLEFQQASCDYLEISQQLETRFVEEFKHIEKKLETYPQYGHPAEALRRRLNFKKFPYHVIYEVLTDHIGIFAIRHSHQLPADYHDRSW